MTKSELIERVSKTEVYPKNRVEVIVNGIINTIMEEISKNNEVKLSGFGSFKVKTRKERKGRNPQTGEELIIPEHKVPVFKFSKNIKERIRQDEIL